MGSQASQTIDERYLRRHLWGQPQRLQLRYPKEFEFEVRAELNSLLAASTQKYSSEPLVADGLRIENIHFRQIFELIFSLRTVRDILWEVLERRVGGYGELKEAITRVRWELILPASCKIGVRVRSLQSRLFHESGIRDVVSAHLSARGHEVVPLDDADCSIEFLIVENRLSILLGCLGRTGNERGFKRNLRAIAPMRSELGACLQARLQRYSGGQALPDLVQVPFAGSGTLAIEAVLGLLHIPVGVFSRSFFWESLPCASRASNEFIRSKMLERASTSVRPVSILVNENDPEQARALRENMDSAIELFRRNLGIDLPFRLLEGDFDSVSWEKGSGQVSLFPLNPPFGERLLSDRGRMQQRIVEWLQRSWTKGSSGYLLSSRDAPKARFEDGPSQLSEDLLRTGGLAIRAQFFGEQA